MKQLEVGDRVKILNGGKDDEGTVLDMDERTEKVIVYLGRHLGGWAFHRDDLRKRLKSVHNGRPTAVPFHARNLDWFKMKNPGCSSDEAGGRRRLGRAPPQLITGLRVIGVSRCRHTL
jgi:hypothetical protein